MEVKKYKYYFRKPKSQIVKDILSWILIAGLITLAATSPYFVINLLKGHKKWQKYPRRKVSDAFYRLRKEGLIKISQHNHQIFISLTPRGKARAGTFQIDSLKIPTPKRWDKKWRMLIFDIEELRKIYREALRGKLKQLGFYPLQKSVWVHPFDCQAEMDLLKDFFGLSDAEFKLIIAETIGDDKHVKKFFNLN